MHVITTCTCTQWCCYSSASAAFSIWKRLQLRIRKQSSLISPSNIPPLIPGLFVPRKKRIPIEEAGCDKVDHLKLVAPCSIRYGRPSLPIQSLAYILRIDQRLHLCQLKTERKNQIETVIIIVQRVVPGLSNQEWHHIMVRAWAWQKICWRKISFSPETPLLFFWLCPQCNRQLYFFYLSCLQLSELQYVLSLEQSSEQTQTCTDVGTFWNSRHNKNCYMHDGCTMHRHRACLHFSLRTHYVL